MRKVLGTLVSLALVAGSAAYGQGVVFDNQLGHSFFTDDHPLPSAPNFGMVPFSLGSNTTLSGGSIYLLWGELGNDGAVAPASYFPTFAWAVYANTIDNNPLASGVSIPSASPGGVTQYFFSLPNVSAPGNVPLWFTIANTNPNTRDDQGNRLWWTPGAICPADGRTSGAGVVDDAAHCYGALLNLQLTGTVTPQVSGGGDVTTTPEPASLAMLGTGLLCCAPFARRRRS